MENKAEIIKWLKLALQAPTSTSVKAYSTTLKETVEALSRVTLCKECKHYEPSIFGDWHLGYCTYTHWLIGPNGFCAYGEENDEQAHD